MLDFEPADVDAFPMLAIGAQRGNGGWHVPVRVQRGERGRGPAFLDGRLPFLGITSTVEATLTEVDGAAAGDLDDLIEADAVARKLAERGLAVA